jgi:hypothetical protein
LVKFFRLFIGGNQNTSSVQTQQGARIRHGRVRNDLNDPSRDPARCAHPLMDLDVHCPRLSKNISRLLPPHASRCSCDIQYGEEPLVTCARRRTTCVPSSIRDRLRDSCCKVARPRARLSVRERERVEMLLPRCPWAYLQLKHAPPR